jgi:hypothetical protein
MSSNVEARLHVVSKKVNIVAQIALMKMSERDIQVEREGELVRVKDLREYQEYLREDEAGKHNEKLLAIKNSVPHLRFKRDTRDLDAARSGLKARYTPPRIESGAPSVCGTVSLGGTNGREVNVRVVLPEMVPRTLVHEVPEPVGAIDFVLRSKFSKRMTASADDVLKKERQSRVLAIPPEQWSSELEPPTAFPVLSPVVCPGPLRSPSVISEMTISRALYRAPTASLSLSSRSPSKFVQ